MPEPWSRVAKLLKERYMNGNICKICGKSLDLTGPGLSKLKTIYRHFQEEHPEILAKTEQELRGSVAVAETTSATSVTGESIYEKSPLFTTTSRVESLPKLEVIRVSVVYREVEDIKITKDTVHVKLSVKYDVTIPLEELSSVAGQKLRMYLDAYSRLVKLVEENVHVVCPEMIVRELKLEGEGFVRLIIVCGQTVLTVSTNIGERARELAEAYDAVKRLELDAQKEICEKVLEIVEKVLGVGR